MLPGSVELRPWRSVEVRGSPELQNAGLRALKEAWDDVVIEAFSCQVWSLSGLLGRVQAVLGASQEVLGGQEVPGGQGKPRAPERWPES